MHYFKNMKYPFLSQDTTQNDFPKLFGTFGVIKANMLIRTHQTTKLTTQLNYQMREGD